MYIAISSAFKVFAKRRMICTYQVGTHAFTAKKTRVRYSLLPISISGET